MTRRTHYYLFTYLSMVTAVGAIGPLDGVPEDQEQFGVLDKALSDPKSRLQTARAVGGAFASMEAVRALVSMLSGDPVIGSAQAADPRPGYVQLADARTGSRADVTIDSLVREINAADGLADANGVIPPEKMPEFFRRLGYDRTTIAAVWQTGEIMRTGRNQLSWSVVLGAILSESLTDRPKIFKDMADKPDEHFDRIFGGRITRQNYSQVFDWALANADETARYKERVATLGERASAEWFDLMNRLIPRMVVQNKYLLRQMITTSSSVIAYLHPEALPAPVWPRGVADQIWRLSLLISNESFVVARLTYGQSLERNTTIRILSTDRMRQIFGDILPPTVYSISEAAARDVGIGANKFVEAAAGKIADQQEDRMIELMWVTNTLCSKINTELRQFLTQPSPALQASLQGKLVELRKLRKEWETYRWAKYYASSMELIVAVEKILGEYKIGGLDVTADPREQFA